MQIIKNAKASQTIYNSLRSFVLEYNYASIRLKSTHFLAAVSVQITVLFNSVSKIC